MIKNASIRVGIKVKPAVQGKNIVSVTQGINQVAVALPGDEVQRIQVDMIHDANSSPNPIYTDCCIHELVGRFVEGYNVTILTYGQTGSGKTFAFQGDAKTPGIISQAIADIFANKTSDAHFKCSFIQLYNERIADMLNTDTQNDKGLRMRWEVQREFVIEDLTEKECNTAEEMMKEWGIGNRNRVVASNKIHDYSSRSHSIFMVTMEDADEEGNWRVRQAYFVDLAGSERVFSPVGRLSKQAIEINKSLFFLRKVVIALEQMSTQRKEQYIPYRDSKLTSILKRAFGGNCLTYLIACINPDPDFLEQTLATLQYAMSAGRIRNTVNVNIDLKAREIKELKEEKEKLRKELELALIQIQNFKSIEREEELKRATNHQYANRIIECIGTVRELLKSNKELRAQLDKQKTQKRRMALDLQELDKSLKQAKRAGTLSPIKEMNQTKTKMGETKTKFMTPKQNKERLNTESVSPEVLMSERPTYSQSVQLLQRKERGNSIIRRRKFLLHERSEQNAARR